MATHDFPLFLAELSQGAFRDELNEVLGDALGKLAERVNATSAKAKGSITITFALVAETNGTVRVDPDVKTKLPEALRETDVFFIDGNNGLTRRNPRQRELAFREVPAPTDNVTIREAK